MGHDETPPAGADHLPRLEIGLVALDQDDAIGHARVIGNYADSDCNHRVGQARPDKGDEPECDQDVRKCVKKIDAAHQHCLHPTAGIARDRPHGDSCDQPDADRDHADIEREVRAVHHAAQDVPAELVGAEGMGELRREQPLADGKLDGIEGRDDRGEDRDDDKQQDHPAADDDARIA